MLNRIAALLSIILWLPTAGCLRTPAPEASEGARAAVASSESNSESPPAALDALRDRNRALIVLSVRSAESRTMRDSIFSTKKAVIGTGEVTRVVWNTRPEGGLRNLESGRVTKFIDHRESARADDYRSTDPETGRSFWVVVQGGILGDPPSVVDAVALDQ